MNVKYGGIKRKDIVITKAERDKIVQEVEQQYLEKIEEMKKELVKRVTRESIERNEEIVTAHTIDNLYFLTLVYVSALIDEGFGHRRLMRFLNKVADIQQELNSGEITAEQLEEKAATKGIVLKDDMEE